MSSGLSWNGSCIGNCAFRRASSSVKKKDGGNERKSESMGSRSKGRRVSEGNNVAEVDIPCIGQTESERNLESKRKERERKKSVELSLVSR